VFLILYFSQRGIEKTDYSPFKSRSELKQGLLMTEGNIDESTWGALHAFVHDPDFNPKDFRSYPYVNELPLSS
jgi:hypothetical protein